MLRIWILDVLLYLHHFNSFLNINFSQMKCGFSANIHCGKKLPHVLLLKYWIFVHFLENAVTTTGFNSNQGAWKPSTHLPFTQQHSYHADLSERSMPRIQKKGRETASGLERLWLVNVHVGQSLSSVIGSSCHLIMHDLSSVWHSTQDRRTLRSLLFSWQGCTLILWRNFGRICWVNIIWAGV